MSHLSGFDSEAVGFDSISSKKRSETSSSTQTTGFFESGVSSQTTASKECGSTADPLELNAQDDILKEYPPPGMNEFLRRVVPGMLEQLDENEKDKNYNSASSDSEEEEIIKAKLFQDIAVTDCNGAGDQSMSILDVSWNSSGNSLAISTGKAQHEKWCTHDGLVRVYTIQRTAGYKLMHQLDITEKNCVSVVKFHHSVSALLAYGTTTGEVVLCNLLDTDEEYTTSPSGCHGSKRVSALYWADANLSHTYLTMQIHNTGKRRGAADQILISSGSNGSLNVWQVNANLRIFEIVVSYQINGSRKLAAPDITCFDFIKSCPLRPPDERVPDDIFVVGTKSGTLFLCKIKSENDPVYEVLEGHRTCVLDVAFSFQKAGVFISASIDSEMRVYDINQGCPLKIIQLDAPISCVSWLPRHPCVAVLGLNPGAVLYNVSSGRRLPIDGLGDGNTSAVDVVNNGILCRIACGDIEGRVRVWELQSQCIRFTPDDLDF